MQHTGSSTMSKMSTNNNRDGCLVTYMLYNVGVVKTIHTNYQAYTCLYM